MPNSNYIRWFKDIRLDDVAAVGGKNASLGELYSALASKGVRVPNGFALTAQAFRGALSEAASWGELHRLLDGLDKRRIDLLSKRAAAARAIVYAATDHQKLRLKIAQAYRRLEQEYGLNVALAVRSSATAVHLRASPTSPMKKPLLAIRSRKNSTLVSRA